MKRSLVVQTTGALAVAALFLTASDASAVELGTPATEHPFRTAQNFALEIRVSPYYPQVDDDPKLNGAKPFENNFGNKARVLLSLELDWQTFRIPHFGTIGPGVGVGSVSMSRSVETVTGRTSGDETSLSIYPFWGVAVVRADVLWRDYGVPLVPYAKGGVGLGIWRASNSAGTATQDGISGKGKSWGTNFALGVGFALDAIDKGASRNMDNATGINNTYVFLEAYWLTLDGIGQSKALHVGTSTWSMGLAFEF